MELDDRGVEMLVFAIVRRAAVDYQMAMDGKLPSKWNVHEIERFFKGNLFANLMPNIDGTAVLEQIKKNYVEHGVTVFEAELL